MNIKHILKKEKIEIIRELSTLETNKIANDISAKLCFAFPTHNLEHKALFISLSRLKMYIAKMPSNLSGAKYILNSNSIYFNDNLSLDDIDKIAVHECIHYIQELKDEKGHLLRLGLSTFQGKTKSMALNEAAVQLMASEANNAKLDNVTYYNISLPTKSPSYYPLECVLVKQMAYFTGIYSLYHSTLFSNDVFKNTFIIKSDSITFDIIQNSLDKLVFLEDELYSLINELETVSEIKIQSLKKMIEKKKKEITDLFFYIQNLIMDKCFYNEFYSIRSMEDIQKFKNKLYKYKNFLGSSADYDYYNNFYCNIMTKLEQKREYIRYHGSDLLYESINTDLDILKNSKKLSTFVKKLFNKFERNSVK